MARRKTGPKFDVEGQTIDSDLPDDSVNEEAFKALQEQYEGDPDE